MRTTLVVTDRLTDWLTTLTQLLQSMTAPIYKPPKLSTARAKLLKPVLFKDANGFFQIRPRQVVLIIFLIGRTSSCTPRWPTCGWLQQSKSGMVGTAAGHCGLYQLWEGFVWTQICCFCQQWCHDTLVPDRCHSSRPGEKCWWHVPLWIFACGHVMQCSMWWPTHRLADDDVAPKVKEFYDNCKNSIEESDGSFVVLQDNLPKPSILVDITHHQW